MDVPTSEVGYTSAMPRREDHEVRKGHVGHWIKKNIFTYRFNEQYEKSFMTDVCRLPVVSMDALLQQRIQDVYCLFLRSNRQNVQKLNWSAEIFLCIINFLRFILQCKFIILFSLVEFYPQQQEYVT